MPLIDLTNVDPYGPQVEAQGRALQQRNQALQSVFDKITYGIQAGRARRERQDEIDRQFRDREYAIVDAATSKLVQPKTNNKFTDVQLQQLGQEFKSDFYNAVKEYQNSDKGDEAKQKFDQAKQRALESARVISGSLESLGNQMDEWRSLYKNGGINPATDPAVREFIADLNDPNTPPDHYSIEEDPETGQLKYVGKTSQSGHDVSFFLEDIANGENQFTPVEKVNMPDLLQNLMRGVTDQKKQVETAFGIAEVTDWSAIGNSIDGRLDQLLQDDTDMLRIAGGLGYTYDEIKNSDPEDLRKEIKDELMMQVESVIPNEIQQAPSFEQREEIQEQQLGQAISSVDSFQQVLTGGDFTGFENQPATIKGLKGNIASIKVQDNGSIKVTVRSGQKGGASQTFDPTNPSQSAQLYSILYNIDYSTALQNFNYFNRINQDLEEIAL